MNFIMVFGRQDITEIYLKVVINTKNGNGFWLNKFFLIFLCEFFFKRNSFKMFFFYIILVLHILVLIVFFYIQCLHRLWNFDRYLFRNLPNYILYIKQILWNKQLKEWFHNCPLVALFILTTLNRFWVLSLWWSWRIRNYIFLFKFGLRLSDFNVYTNLWSRRWWSRTNLQKVISFLIW